MTILKKRCNEEVSKSSPAVDVVSSEDEEESESLPPDESSIMDVNCTSCRVKLFEKVSYHFLILM